MRRILFFVLVATVVIGIAWFIAGIPGHFTASFGSVSIETSAPVAILGFILFAAVILAIWHIVGWLLSLPTRGAAWSGRRVRKRGDEAITRLLIAMAADDKREAWKEARRARRLLGDSPYTLLLLAEAGRMSGRDEEADRAFRLLAARRDARFLGLRGLLRQAVAREDWPGAMEIAREAENVRPGTAWVRQERAELAIKTENWAEALELLGEDERRPTYLVAAADSEPDSSRALQYAKRAFQIAPSFTPAAVAYARRLRGAGQERRAQRVISRAWKLAPHPDLAAVALEGQVDKTARLQAAKRLVSVNPGNAETRLLLAQVALDAGSLKEARYYADQLVADGFRQRRVYLLLAEIEEQERGDTEEGRLAQREALRQAAVADPDSRWQCSTCRSDFDAWHPKCTVCQSVGTISWVATAARSEEKLPVLEQALQHQA